MADGNVHRGFFRTRFCTSCRAVREPEGGVYVKSKDGRTRRWKCGQCVVAAKLQKEKRHAQ